MQLSCEVCHAPLRPEDVQEDTSVARCQSCKAIYDLSGRKGRGLAARAQDRPRFLFARVALPSRFKMEDEGGITRISWRWFRLSVLNQLLFCVLLDGFMVVWILALILDGEMGGNGKILCSLCAVPMFVLAVFLTYDTLAKLVNSTTLEVSHDRLSIRHGPILWRDNLEFQGHQLAQLYGKEVVYTSTDETFTETTITYDLMALVRESSKEVTLLTQLEEKEQVLYLEQLLEHRLGIEDAPVDGEVATRTPSA